MALHTAVTATESRKGPDKDKWGEVEDAEQNALEKMGVWVQADASELLPNEKPIPPGVLLYLRKGNGRYKVRAVALGNRQDKNGLEYDCYSPTVSQLAIRMALVEAARRGDAMRQFDVSIKCFC
jgi:hypothetical protein